MSALSLVIAPVIKLFAPRHSAVHSGGRQGRHCPGSDVAPVGRALSFGPGEPGTEGEGRGQQRALPTSCLEPGPEPTWGPGHRRSGKTGDSETALPGPHAGDSGAAVTEVLGGVGPGRELGAAQRGPCFRDQAGSATLRQRRPVGTTGHGGPLLPGRHEVVKLHRKPGSVIENTEVSFLPCTPDE